MVCGTALWVKVFYAFRLTELLGPLFMVLSRMIADIFLYFVLFTLELFLFALLATLFFRDLPEYDNLSSSIVTLFKAGWGLNFSYGTFANSRFSRFWGDLFLTIYLVLTVLLLANLLAAMLNTAYRAYGGSKKGLMIKQTLQVRAFTEADKRYSCLISAPPPLHALNFLYFMLLLELRRPERLNLFVLHLQYVPVMIVSTVLYIAYNAVLLPFAFAKVAVHKFALIFSGRVHQLRRSNRADRVGSAILFLFAGLPILLLDFLVDIVVFLRHLYWNDLEKTYLAARLPNVSRRTYKKLHEYF